MDDREHIRQFMAAHLDLPVEKLPDEASLYVDLDLDSFKTITLHLALEVECGIELEPDDNISTVGQLIDAMQAAKYCAPTQISTIRIVR